jgi:amino acid adenylation domain-containing protein
VDLDKSRSDAVDSTSEDVSDVADDSVVLESYADRARALPLSFGQRQLWLIDQLNSNHRSYIVYDCVRLSGSLDLGALESALAAVVRRHEALRTVYDVVDGEPVQRVLPADTVKPRLDVVEVGGASGYDVVSEWVRRPFDLAQAPMVRAIVARTGADEALFCLAVHHIAVDGWSLGIVLGEISRCYSAVVAGVEVDLPPVSVDYADFAVWQRTWLTGPAVAQQLTYWAAALAGAPALLELPWDRPRPAVAVHAGEVHWVRIRPALAGLVRGLGLANGATLFMVLLAAFKVVLARWSGQGDVLVGTPTAGRSRVDLEQVVGYFVNTLVLRTDVDLDAGFAALLARVREVTLGALAHQDVPFEMLVQQLAPEREPSHNPLFQVLFAMQNSPGGGVDLAGLSAEPVRMTTGSSKFDLSVSWEDDGAAGLTGRFEYDPALFDRGTIERFAEHYLAVLSAVAGDSAVALREISLVSPRAREAQLSLAAGPRREIPHQCLHELIEEQVAARPDDIAVRSGGRSLTYRELDRKANTLAHHLIGMGVRPGAAVGVVIERGFELIVSILAVLKAGAAYVPVDPDNPVDRMRYVLDKAGVTVVLTAAATADIDVRDNEFDREVVRVDEVPAEGLPTERPNVEMRPDGLAYVIFTSGSTGNPKGAMVHHRAAVNRIRWMMHALEVGPGDRVLQKTSIGFDVSVWELLMPLMAGGRLVFAAPRAHRDPVEIAKVMSAERVTLVHFVPAMLGVFLEQEPIPAFPDLSAVVCSGEALPAPMRDLAESSLSVPVYNLYGPTEAAIDVTWYPAGPQADGARRATVPLGRPIDNTQVYVLGGDLRPQPIGLPGEVYIGGVAVGRGYIDEPGLTAERFVPDPFGADGAVLYQTGDKGRLLPDGNIEYLGRLDHQVKIRGFRVELGEIESALRAHPLIEDATVVLDANGQSLSGFVLPAGGPAATDGICRVVELPWRAEIGDYLATSLPDYMIPASLTAVSCWPITRNGKIDRSALAGLAEKPAPAAHPTEGPRSPIEAALAGLVGDLLGTADIGRTQSFFGAGGNSILVVKLLSRIRALFDVTVSVQTFFENPTIARLAEAIAAQQQQRAAGAYEGGIARVSRDRPLPVSFGQRGMLFTQQLLPDTSRHVLFECVRLSGVPDVAALRQALTTVIGRHEALRTVYDVVDGEPVQVVRSSYSVDPLEIVDATDGAEVARDVVARTFDLAAGPAVRAVLARETGGDSVFCLAAHHIAADGWSMGILLADLSRAYAALVAGVEANLPPGSLDYADFAVWQRQRRTADELAGSLRYWEDRLAGAPALLELPWDRPRPAVLGSAGGMHWTRIDPELAAAVRALANTHQATLFMVLLAACATVLARWSGQNDVVVGTPVAGRERIEWESIVGLFANTVVLRNEVDLDAGFGAMVDRVRDGVIDAFTHQDVPFEMLVERLAPERELSRNPLFQVLFVVRDAPSTVLDLAGMPAEPVDLGPEQTQFDLSITWQDEGEAGLACAIHYNPELFDAATIARFGEHCATLLSSATANPMTPLRSLGLLSGRERDEVLAAGTGPGNAPPPEWVHEQIAAHARRDPGALAVRDGERTIGYGELDGRANHVARQLIALGVRPDCLVAVVLPRGIELVVSLLGVLKAGAAYTPVDPASPAQRLERIMRQALPAAVVTVPELADRLPADLPCPVLFVDDTTSAHGPEVTVRGDSLAYVIFTSGSTGEPKGAMNHHLGLANLCDFSRRALAQDEHDRVAMLSAVSFDAQVVEVWTNLTCGASLHVVDDTTRMSPELFRGFLLAERITRSYVPSPLVRSVSELDWPAGTALRAVLTGGDRLQWPVGQHPWTVYNSYGPSETSVAVTWAPTGPADGSREVPPVGVPLDNVRTYVLDEDLRLRPIGAPGRLYVGGIGVGRGYLGDPALTAQRFIPDPFGPAGSVMYDSGDSVRLLATGELDFLGRLDHQVKIRGFRVEPGEIEAALRAHPLITDAMVRPHDRAERGRELVGHLQLPHGALTASSVRDHLRERLPDYMIPARFTTWSAFPLTDRGKVDLLALARRAPLPTAPPAPRRADRAVDELVAGIWRSVLGSDEFGFDQNFFDAGGNSVLLTTLAQRLGTATGITVGLVELFANPTVFTQGELVLKRQAGIGDEPDDVGEDANDSEYLPRRRRIARKQEQEGGHEA